MKDFPRVIVGTWPRLPPSDAIALCVMSQVIFRGRFALHLPRLQFDLVRLMLASRGKGWRMGEIIEMLWSDDPEGGPLNPANTVSGTLHAANRKLTRLDLRISNGGSRGLARRFMFPRYAIVDTAEEMRLAA